MAVHTFDEFCELEEREYQANRSGILVDRMDDDDDAAGFEWIDDSETRGYEAADDLIRESGELEEIY